MNSSEVLHCATEELASGVVILVAFEAYQIVPLYFIVELCLTLTQTFYHKLLTL